MKNIWENPWFVIPVLLFFNTGLLIVYFIPYGTEILLLNDLREEPFNSLFRFITLLGEFYPFVLFGVAALFWRFRYALLIALAGLITIPTVYLLKEEVGVDRPVTWFKNQGLRSYLVTVPDVEMNTGQTSFPSGHTTAAFSLYSILTLLAGRKRIRLGLVFALTAILVAISRVFLVQHFLADILSGAVLGLAISWIVWQINGAGFFNRLSFLDRHFPTGSGRLLSNRRDEKSSNDHVF